MVDRLAALRKRVHAVLEASPMQRIVLLLVMTVVCGSAVAVSLYGELTAATPRAWMAGVQGGALGTILACFVSITHSALVTARANRATELHAAQARARTAQMLEDFDRKTSVRASR